MSDYRQTPHYGAPYSDQANNPYITGPYANQYGQTGDGSTAQNHYAQNYHSSMAAYGYNGTVPGFGPPPTPSGVPVYSGYYQPPPQMPQYNAPQLAQNHDYNSSNYANYGYQPGFQAPAQPSHSQEYPLNSQREASLSEGEFDARANPAPVTYETIQRRANDGTGYMDSAHRAVYARSQDTNPVQPTRSATDYSRPQDSSQVRSRHSASYSPYAPSPQADRDEADHQYNIPSSKVQDEKVTGLPTTQNTPSWAQNRAVDMSQPTAHANGNHVAKAPGSSDPRPEASDELAGAEKSATHGSLTEAKKKAQGAILNLWPHEVRFQTYIDEGFDDTLVRKLFLDLGMPTTPSKPGKETAPSQKKVDAVFKNGNAGQSQPAGAKASPTTSLPALTTQSSVPRPELPSAAPKSAVAIEKERTLQLKMEALRKSREERAQKAAAKVNPQAPVNPVKESEGSKTVEVANSTTPHAISPPKSEPPTKNIVSGAGHVIPGLFLATNGSAPLSVSTNVPPSYVAPSVNQRKRPVAADFDNVSSVTPLKRPFGQSRNEAPLVIDVSEEEAESDDEDVAMDLESQADPDSPSQGTRRMSDQRVTSTTQSNPSVNSRSFTPTGAVAGNRTPPASQTVRPAEPPRLQQVELQMLELRKKIAEAEAKRRSQNTSGMHTPQPTEAVTSNIERTTGGDISSTVEASVNVQHKLDATEDKIVADQRRLADAQLTAVEKATELQQDEAEKKRLRRSQIASDLPRVNAEVSEKQRRLEEVRAQMAEIEASIQRDLDEKQKLADEMKKLSQDAEDQLQAQKDKLSVLTADRNSPEPGPVVDFPIVSKPPDLPLPALASTQGEAQLTTETAPDIDSNVTETVPMESDLAAIPIQSARNTSDEAEEPQVNGSAQAGSPQATESPNALEAALQEALRAEADSHMQTQSPESDEMDIDAHAPSPGQVPMELPIDQSKSSSSSSSGSSYSPVLARASPALSEAESDNYEPPDAQAPVEDSPTAKEVPSPAASPPFSPAPPNIVSNNLAAVSTGNDHHAAFNPKLKARDNIPAIGTDPGVGDQSQVFVPYESPLKVFHAFRFHPEYTHEVPGGLRSMTYSHKIDPLRELCRWELAGGTCNDNTCELQHFKDMGIADDVILATLGSPDEFTGEQRRKFCDGLKEVLNGLRARKIRDFDIITQEILAHRAKFLGDPSKILALEDVSI